VGYCNHFTSLVVIHKETDPDIVLSMFTFSFIDPAIEWPLLCDDNITLQVRSAKNAFLLGLGLGF
jgi:hypothetical protein